jgi:hypothetical protein
MKAEEQIAKAEALARKYNREGWGSRASVLHAIYDIFKPDISYDSFILICSVLDGFHGVAAGFYEDGKGYGIPACGALCGGVAAFFMIKGKKEYPFPFWTEGMKPDGWITTAMNDKQSTPKSLAHEFLDHTKPLGYGGSYQIVSRFKEHFGHTDCMDLVKPYGHNITHDCFKNCHKMIIKTAGIVTRVILEYEKNPESLLLGDRNPLLYICRPENEV